MITGMTFTKVSICAALVLGSVVQQVHGVAINVDELLFQNDPGNPALAAALAASIDIDATGAQLKILLKNTTPTTASSGAFVLLTGMGFELPSGLSIASGSASIPSGSSAVGWTVSLANDLSKEWGYKNGHPGSGHLDGNGTPGLLFVNSAVSSMGVDAPSRFMTGSIAGAPDLGGPDFGVLSAAGVAGGQKSVRDSVLLTLNLSSAFVDGDAALESYIESHNVVVTFSSPDSVRKKVSDNGSNLVLLMGSALIGAALLGRSRQNV